MAEAHQVDYQLIGDDMQAVIITLDPQEAVQAEDGAMMFLEDGIRVNTGTGGGFMKGLKRAISGESFFITTFYNESQDKRKLAFSAPYPGKILALPLHENGPMLCQRLLQRPFGLLDPFVRSANNLRKDLFRHYRLRLAAATP